MAYQVLLVDDELPALRFIQSIIEKYAPDFQVTHTCPSGEKAYEYLQSHAVDVLITDIAMQRMNGIGARQAGSAGFSRTFTSSSSAATQNLSLRRALFRPPWTTTSSSPWVFLK